MTPTQLDSAWRAAPLALFLCACADESGSAGTSDGSGEGPPETLWFTEAGPGSGLDFVHVSGHVERYYFPEAMTTGAALFDADGDGDLDAYLVQGGSVLDDVQAVGNRLYLNRGDGTFVDATEGSGADDRGYGMGATTGDYDGDGDLDLYVTNLGDNALLRNDGGGRFTDVTADSGTAGETWSTGAAFLDYDADGDLDLFVANYVLWSAESDPVCQNEGREATYCGPRTYESPTADTLFRNDGDGTFTDVSRSLGIADRKGNGLGVVVADFDDDGFPEVFVANDASPNHLWQRGEDGRFEETASWMGCAVDNLGAPKAGMGVALTDLDRDGDEDLLVVNLGGENDSFFRNDGDRFLDRTAAVGLSLTSRRYTRFGVGLVDLDHDGVVDAFHANGRVNHPPGRFTGDPFAEPNVVMRGTGEGRFEVVDPPHDIQPVLASTSRSAAFGDVDGDGDLDVLVHNKDERAHLLLNTAPKRGSWAKLRVLDTNGGDALGATLDVAFGGDTLRTEVRTSWSYCAASTPAVHLGLGQAEGIDEVRVRWPDGTREAFGPLASNAVHILERGAGR